MAGDLLGRPLVRRVRQAPAMHEHDGRPDLVADVPPDDFAVTEAPPVHPAEALAQPQGICVASFSGNMRVIVDASGIPRNIADTLPTSSPPKRVTKTDLSWANNVPVDAMMPVALTDHARNVGQARCGTGDTRSRSCLRSLSFRPPQMPCGSRIRTAYSRQSGRTQHDRQIPLAARSRMNRSSLRSTWDGGKKTTACGPLHAARACHNSSPRLATTMPLLRLGTRTLSGPVLCRVAAPQDRLEGLPRKLPEPPFGPVARPTDGTLPADLKGNKR